MSLMEKVISVTVVPRSWGAEVESFNIYSFPSSFSSLVIICCTFLHACLFTPLYLEWRREIKRQGPVCDTGEAEGCNDCHFTYGFRGNELSVTSAGPFFSFPRLWKPSSSSSLITNRPSSVALLLYSTFFSPYLIALLPSLLSSSLCLLCAFHFPFTFSYLFFFPPCL